MCDFPQASRISLKQFGNFVMSGFGICPWTLILLITNISLHFIPVWLETFSLRNSFSTVSEPKTRAGPLLPSPPLTSPPPPPSRFLHRLQTSITRSFIKLECFLRPFLKTRSHDESAHTFKSSLRFSEVPQKGVKKNAFFYHIFLHVWSYRIR